MHGQDWSLGDDAAYDTPAQQPVQAPPHVLKRAGVDARPRIQRYGVAVLDHPSSLSCVIAGDIAYAPTVVRSRAEVEDNSRTPERTFARARLTLMTTGSGPQ